LGIYFTAKSFSADGNVRDLRAAIASGNDPNAAGGGSGPGCLSGGATCSQLQDALHDRSTATAHSREAFIVAGVLGAVTLTTFLLWPRSERPSASKSWQVGGQMGRESGAMWLRTSF
jgi:hypothetical protein